MELILLIIAGVVMYYLYNSFQNYLKNPYSPNQNKSEEYNIEDNPYIQLSDEDRIKDNEYGILTRIFKNIASSDGEICVLEKELLANMLDDIADQMQDIKDSRILLQNIFDNSNDDLDELAQKYCDLTKGEYKKRLKVVEFIFTIAYADGILDEKEREKIIDIAAIFELNNDDFNRIYDDFESQYSSEVNISKDEALGIFGLGDEYTKEDLLKAYKDKIKESKQNILLNKNLDKSLAKGSLQELRRIDSAYKVLLNNQQ